MRVGFHRTAGNKKQALLSSDMVRSDVTLSMGMMTEGCPFPRTPTLMVGAAASPYAPAFFVVKLAVPVCKRRLNSLAASVMSTASLPLPAVLPALMRPSIRSSLYASSTLMRVLKCTRPRTPRSSPLGTCCQSPAQR